MDQRVAVVVCSFDQGDLIREAVDSVLAQTRPPEAIVVVDDGSTDPHSLSVLNGIEKRGVRVIRQPNRGVSAARNAGIAAVGTELVAVLDGDDRYHPEYLARVVAEFSDEDTVAASSWITMFGAAHGVVRPAGGSITNFLAKNSCPAAVVVRRKVWAAVGGYAEDMREGFEDWDFFLRVLTPGGRIGIVPAPLIEYRTDPGSANVASMTHRLRLYEEIVGRHSGAFAAHLSAALVAQEATSIERLNRWEQLVLNDSCIDPGETTYGDGGMAAIVRIATARA
jgi:glycosyltransferase involved in cell wall biosynthesis